MNNNELIEKAVVDQCGAWKYENRCQLFICLKSTGEFSEGSFCYASTGQYELDGKMKSKPHWEFICTRSEFESTAKRMGYINGYLWGKEYPTNGKRPDLVDGISVVVQVNMQAGFTGAFPMYMREDWSNVVLFKITDPRYKPVDEVSADALSQAQSLTHGEEGLAHSEWWDYEIDQPVSRPPIGVEVLLPPKFDEKSKAVVVGYFNVDTVLYSNRADSYFGVSLDGNKMRPLDHATRKAELHREKVIEAAVATLKNSGWTHMTNVSFKAIDALLDAGMLVLPQKSGDTED